MADKIQIVGRKVGDEWFVGASIPNRGFCTFRKKDYPDLELLYDALLALALQQMPPAPMPLFEQVAGEGE